MHSAKGHTVIDERWRFELALAAACRSFAPRASELFAPANRVAVLQQDSEPRYISYYSYRYL